MGDIGQLRVRIMSYGAGLDTALTIAGAGPTPWLYGDRLRMGGIKLFADGALGSITATKQRRIVWAARHFLSRLPKLPPCRFDVVVIEQDGRAQWLQAAFEASA